MTTTIELDKHYWVVHTDYFVSGKVRHTKQVMQEVWKDGETTEEPLSERYIVNHEDFERAIHAYNWNKVLGEPSDYIKKGEDNVEE